MDFYNIDIFNVEFNEDENFIVEDIENYLKTEAVKTLSFKSQAPITPTLTFTMPLEIKEDITFNQYPSNYLRLEYIQGNKVYYYFITGVVRNANNVQILTLKMDTLNTFDSQIETGLSPKTKIIRQHIKRFKNITKFPTRPTSEISIEPIIHNVSEGLQPNLITKGNEIIRQDLGQYQADYLLWYLIYKTRTDLTPENTSVPIDTYMCANKELLIQRQDPIPTKVILLNGSGLNMGVFSHPFTFFTRDVSRVTPTGEINIRFPSKNATQYPDVNINLATFTTYDYIVVQTRQATNFVIYGVKDGQETELTGYTGSEAVFDRCYFELCKNALIDNDGALIRTLEEVEQLPKSFIGSGTHGNDIKVIPITEVDRTDTRLMKIVEVPYCPSKVHVDENQGYVFDNSDWVFDDTTGLLKRVNPLIEYPEVEIDIINNKCMTKIPKNAQNESSSYTLVDDPKLFHSDFYLRKFSYDSYNKVLPAELDNSNYDIKFKMSYTISSNFTFAINNIFQTSEVDYSPFVNIVNRNNEIPIFSSNYIEYVRSGYNYDIKEKNLNLMSNILSGITGGSKDLLGASIATIINPAIRMDVSANAGLSISQRAINTITSDIGNQLSIDRKLDLYSKQATSVAGSNDIDLLNYYTGGGKAVMFYYSVTEHFRKALNSLFHFYGYAINEYGKPDFNNRSRFNYIECEPVFTGEFMSRLPAVYRNDIDLKLRRGVTKIHNCIDHDSIIVNVHYDFEQRFINWEKGFIYNEN